MFLPWSEQGKGLRSQLAAPVGATKYLQCCGLRGLSRGSLVRGLRTQIGCPKLAQIKEWRAQLFTGVIQVDQVVRTASRVLNPATTKGVGGDHHLRACPALPNLVFFFPCHICPSNQDAIMLGQCQKEPGNNLTSQLSSFQHSLSVTREIGVPFLFRVFYAGSLVSSPGHPSRDLGNVWFWSSVSIMTTYFLNILQLF